MSTASTASKAKTAEPVVTVVAAPKSKVVVAVAPIVSAPVVIAPVVSAVTTSGKAAPVQAGSSTVQPSAIGIKNKVVTASPATGVAQHTVVHY
jgi:hypothetical protein